MPKCRHVYEYVGEENCPDCGEYTHETNWEKVNESHRKWLKDNPDAWKTVGWWSI